MYRVTRKQVVRQKTESWEGECNCSAASEAAVDIEDHRDLPDFEGAKRLADIALVDEQGFGGRYIPPNKVVFETPSFYRSVTVTIEELK